MDTGERNQVSLELVKIDVQRAIKTERGGDRGDNLSDQPVEVGEARRGDTEPLLADVVNSFVVNHERAVGVLEGGMSRQDGVVRLDNGVGHRGCRVHAELELGLLAIVGRETLEDEGTKTRASSATEGVEDKEALQATAVVRQAPDLIHHSINHLFADSVMTASV